VLFGNNISIVAEDDLIYLRRVSKDDLDCYYRWYRDPEIQRFMANPNWDPNRSRDDYRHVFLQKHLIQTGTSMTLTICLSLDKTPVGLVSYFEIDRENGCCELGVIVGEKDHWRKGIASSAIRLATSYIFDTAGLTAIYCNILEENRPSISLFEKCGFLFREVTVDSGIEFLRYQFRKPQGASEK